MNASPTSTLNRDLMELQAKISTSALKNKKSKDLRKGGTTNIMEDALSNNLRGKFYQNKY